MENKWKIIAIIFIVICIIETVFIVGSYINYVNEENKIKECFYDICSGYVEADYEDGVCICYEYDTMGYLIVAKEKLME